MIERPLVFSGPMVRAILAGTSTQTRRLVIPPRVVPGDRLWVRETWAYDLNVDREESPEILAWARDHRRVWYRADPGVEQTGCGGAPGRWRPSIYMPRWASRITLELTDVREQRLQDISEEDARAEGMLFLGGIADDFEMAPWADPGDRERHPWRWARAAFRVAWDGINGKRATWESNPQVWALTFRRIRP